MYHMSKAHWNTISLQSDVSDDEIKQLIDHSYQTNEKVAKRIGLLMD
jgi:predicted DNA-binding protein (MmcQ/YjbR family)